MGAGITKCKAPHTVLLADPDIQTREKLRECIEACAAGTRILEASTVAEAGTLAADVRVDLAAIELKARDFDGTSLLRFLKDLSLRQRPGHILVYSELLDPEAAKHSNRLVSFLHKPFPVAVLQQILRQHLNEVEIPVPSAEPPKIDPMLIDEFCKGVMTFFSQKMDCDIGRERMLIRRNEWLTGDTGGMIPLRCRIFEGQWILLMDHVCFLAVTNRLLSSQHERVNEKNLAALAGFCTQAFEYARISLNDRGYGFESTSAQALEGVACRFAPGMGGRVCVTHHFKTPFGEFDLEVQIERLLRAL